MAKSLLFGENTTEKTSYRPLGMMCHSRCVTTSHNHTLPSQLPDARSLPSGEKCTAQTCFVCPLRGGHSCHVVVSQTTTAGSSPAADSSLPTGDNSSPCRGPRCRGRTLSPFL